MMSFLIFFHEHHIGTYNTEYFSCVIKVEVLSTSLKLLMISEEANMSLLHQIHIVKDIYI